MESSDHRKELESGGTSSNSEFSACSRMLCYAKVIALHLHESISLSFVNQDSQVVVVASARTLTPADLAPLHGVPEDPLSLWSVMQLDILPLVVIRKLVAWVSSRAA